MGVDYKVRGIYASVIGEVTKSEQAWKKVCQLMGQIYRYEFDNVLMVYAQKPSATLVADYDTWKKVDRYVKRGSKGIAIFPSRALKPYMRYVFDVKDTGGKKQKLTWDLEGENLRDYYRMLAQEGKIEAAEEVTKEEMISQIWDFTKEQIKVIIKEEFAERMTEVNTLTGRVIMGEDSKTSELTVNELVLNSIYFTVGTRCGFGLSSKEQDISRIVNVTDEDTIYALGSLVCDVSCTVLRSFSKSIAQLEQERRMNYERNGNHVSGERGRTSLSDTGSGRGKLIDFGQVRNARNGVSKGEPQDEVSVIAPVRETDGEAQGSGGGSEPDVRPSDAVVSQEPSTEGQTFHHGDVEDSPARNDDGGRDRDEGNREPVSLETEAELNRELEELDSFGLNGEVSYTQASLFDYMGTTSSQTTNSFLDELKREEAEAKAKGIYTYLNPKKETVVPQEYIKQVLLRGSGFQGGKERIYNLYHDVSDAKERANLLKKEYGQGGAGWPLDGYGLHGYDTFHGKGIRLQWRDEIGEHEGYISWKSAEAEIGALILTGEYYHPINPVKEALTKAHAEVTERTEALADDVLEATDREDGITVAVDEDDHELSDDEIEEILEADRRIAEERYEAMRFMQEMDDLAHAKDANPNPSQDTNVSDVFAGLNEDEAVTMAEYGAEFGVLPSAPKAEKEQAEIVEAGNFHLNVWKDLEGGPKQRCSWNLDALRLLKELEESGRGATKDEQQVLSRYVGWGGLSQVFDEEHMEWTRERQEMKEFLTPEEYREARSTVTDAFYTPPYVASAMYSALLQFGFDKGNVLEPSMGVGNFFGSIPESLSACKLYGIEKDSVSGRIAKYLYPDAKIDIQGFEDSTYPDNFFDVVIGNVPFGDFKVYDRRYNAENFRIHDYFIAKAIDQVRPGGVVAVITTKGTLDKQNSSVRKYLAERAELVGAIRLPDSTFYNIAGTKVTSDILFFQKRERKMSVEPDWVHLGMTEDGVPVNQYFVLHPEMMLGHMEYDRGRFGDSSSYTVCVQDEDYRPREAIQRAISNLPSQIVSLEEMIEEEEKAEDIIPANPDVKNYTYTFFDGKLYFRRDSMMYRQEVSEKVMERIKGMNDIRACTRHLITIQTEGCSEEELVAAQKELNTVYDAYVKKYGYITSQMNARAFRDDGDYPLLCSLEVVDEDGRVSKADMFTKQTIKAKVVVDHVETAVEALNISINEFNGVNIPYMLSIYTPDISKEIHALEEEIHDSVSLSVDATMELRRAKMIEELSGLIFLNPQEYNEADENRGWETADTMCELYVMQSFLQKDTLEQLGIYHFDSWAANFGEQTTALELTVEGSGFRFKTRFNKFTNLPELMNLFKEVADIQTRDMLDLDIPRLRDDKYIIVESEPDYFVKEVMENFVKRAEAIRNGGVDPSVDNFLKITHEARLLGTDARLLEADAPNNPDGKLNKVVDNVVYEYEKAKQEGKIGTQLIFSDIGTPKGSWKEEMTSDDFSWGTNSDATYQEFDVYNYIKTELVKQGIPAAEIAFIHDANTDAQKDTLFREMRAGTKKVLIGSTDKCGTGVNVQTHLTAMHHIDCPWKPSSIEQREGRGLRQGNENTEVAVYRYVTKGTFDAYSWSLVENKQRFISQIMTSKSISRTCEDIDEATLSYAEIKAVATGNPLIKEKMEIDNDVQRLKMLKASYDSSHYSLQDQFMIKFPKLIAAAKEKLACVHTDIKARDEALLADSEFAVKIGGVTYAERADGGNALIATVAGAKTGVTTEIGEYKGFSLLVEKNFMGLNYLVLRGKTDYKVELSTSPVGNMVKMENCFNGIQGNVDFLEKKLSEYERDMEQAKLEYEKPFQYEQELTEKLKRQFELNTMLDLENKPIAEDKEENLSHVAEPTNPYPNKKEEGAR